MQQAQKFIPNSQFKIIPNSTFYILHYHDIVPRYPCTDRCGGFLYAPAR